MTESPLTPEELDALEALAQAARRENGQLVVATAAAVLVDMSGRPQSIHTSSLCMTSGVTRFRWSASEGGARVKKNSESSYSIRGQRTGDNESQRGLHRTANPETVLRLLADVRRYREVLPYLNHKQNCTIYRDRNMTELARETMLYVVGGPVCDCGLPALREALGMEVKS